MYTIWSKHNEHNSAAKSLGIWSNDVMQPSWAGCDNLYRRHMQALKSNYLLNSAGRCARVLIEARVTPQQWEKKNTRVKLKQSLIIPYSIWEFSPSFLLRIGQRGCERINGTEREEKCCSTSLDLFSCVSSYQHFLVATSGPKIRSQYCSSTHIKMVLWLYS